MGLPIFAGGGGAAYILRPTFGYLIGFIAAAYLIGRIVEQKPRPGYTRTLMAMAVGLGAVYLFGVTVFYVNVRLLNVHLLTEGPPSFRSIFIFGCLLPLPGDALKILAAAYLATRISEKKRKNQVHRKIFIDIGELLV
jgi:biotin transport system substrate-specific component